MSLLRINRDCLEALAVLLTWYLVGSIIVAMYKGYDLNERIGRMAFQMAFLIVFALVLNYFKPLSLRRKKNAGGEDGDNIDTIR